MPITYKKFKDIILDKEKFRINLINILKETESDLLCVCIVQMPKVVLQKFFNGK